MKIECVVQSDTGTSVKWFDVAEEDIPKVNQVISVDIDGKGHEVMICCVWPAVLVGNILQTRIDGKVV